jgi:hypothetical protein
MPSLGVHQAALLRIQMTNVFSFVQFSSLKVNMCRVWDKLCSWCLSWRFEALLLEMQDHCVMQEIHANYLTELLLALLIFYASVSCRSNRIMSTTVGAKEYYTNDFQ